VHGFQQRSTGEVINVSDGAQHQHRASGLGGDLTAEQQALLLQLQTETGLRGAQRKLQDKQADKFPPGVAGFEAPKGVEVPVVPFMGSPDQPSIDVFSWLIAAKMEGGRIVVQQLVKCSMSHNLQQGRPKQQQQQQQQSSCIVVLHAAQAIAVEAHSKAALLMFIMCWVCCVACCADFVIPAGYPLENHKVVTRDGYILNMYRIPHGKYRNTQKGNKPVVLLQHGVTLSSNSFVLLNANESMAYILADAGESQTAA
jgi:hypothetical protein